ncbi:hypothetical protein GQR58_014032 [Nymphon striatum]|nr:hypothetical protein GQR58_014032 [Nymphon striatum]
MLGTFCRMVHSALLSAEIIPIDLEMCVVCKVRMLVTFCRWVHPALLSAEIIPIDLEICGLCKVFFASNGNFSSFLCAPGSQIFLGRVRLKCLVHFVDMDILRCCRQKLFKSTKKCVLCARFSWHPTGISVPFCASQGSQIF